MNLQKNMSDGDIITSNNGLLIKNGELISCYDDNLEVIVPDVVTSIAEDCFRKKRIKRVAVPNSVENISFHAFNECIIRELILEAQNTSKYIFPFNECRIKSLVLSGKNLEYDLLLHGCSVSYLVVENGVRKVRISSGNIKNIILSSTVEMIENDSFKCDGLFSLTIGDRTWLSPGSLNDVGALVVYFNEKKGIRALRYISSLLETAGSSNVAEVVLVDSELNILEFLKLKRMYPNVRFILKTLEEKNMVTSQNLEENQESSSRTRK